MDDCFECEEIEITWFEWVFLFYIIVLIFSAIAAGMYKHRSENTKKEMSCVKIEECVNGCITNGK